MTIHTKTCPVCSATFTTKRESKRFCSYACSCSPGVKKKKNKPGEGTIGPFGYRYLRINGRKTLEHRYVMALHLGRDLTPGEVVHHKDGNKLNNSISNLELLATQSEHTTKHIKRFSSETHKECSLCLIIKSRDEFYKRGKGGHNKDQHQAYCRMCSDKKAVELREKKKSLPPMPCSVCGAITLSCRVNAKQRCSKCHRKKFEHDLRP